MKTPKSGKRTTRKPADEMRSVSRTPSWATRDDYGRLVVNIAPAKAHLSELMDRIANGEVVVLARAGKPEGELTRIDPWPKKRVFGQMRGRMWISPDFDELGPEWDEYVK
jgi:antitoxin (DNA-binding transcriptional repressor) of toxin-antitoxin stability system